MSAWLLLICAIASALAASRLTDAVRRYALSRAVLDAPNARSLHTEPTPRGGGLAIAAVVLAVQAVALALGWIEPIPGLAWGLGAAALACLGWRDDREPLGSLLRLGVQFLVATVAVTVLFNAHAGAGTVGVALLVAAVVVGCVWMVNLYNFMDGSDGIAGTQAVTAGAGGAILALMLGLPGVALVAAAIAGANVGFLRWNWQPARIFMGDVGSYFLGWQFALLAAYSGATGAPWIHWLILLAPFVTDATATLLRRLLRGERWFEAHRSHAYQRLVRGGASHRRVALGLGLWCAGALWPLAFAAARWPQIAPLAAIAAYGLNAALWVGVMFHARRLVVPDGGK